MNVTRWLAAYAQAWREGDAGAIAEAERAYESFDVPKGTLRGSPPVPDDDLFVSPWIYRWGLLFEYSITSYWVGELHRAIGLLRRA